MAISDNTVVQTVNMVDHPISYVLKEQNIIRRFEPYETKNLTIGELRTLNYKQGGRFLLREYLSVKNDAFRKELGIPEDAIEYDYTVYDIDRILLEESDDVLKDTLEFGPRGIVELIQSRAVKLKIPDVGKRDIIKQFTSVDINKQIELQEQQEEALKIDSVAVSAEEASYAATPQRKRRVAVTK